MLRQILRKLHFTRWSVVLPVLALVSTQGMSATSYLDPERILYDRPDASTQLELIECFTTGNCKHDDKIRIYPIQCEGSNGADCTGCYEMRGSTPFRVDDLNSAGNCSGVGSASAQKLRVFVGYERNCPGSVAPGGSCTDGQLLLSCRISSDTSSPGGGGAPTFAYDRDCFSGRPYVRRARSVTNIVTALPSTIPMGPPYCDVGSGGTYPSCSSCSDTSYKSTTGDGACIECGSIAIVNSENTIYSTAGTSKSSPNDCRVTSFTCKSGFVKNDLAQTCDLPPPPSPTPSPTSPLGPSSSPTPAPSPLDCGSGAVELRTTYVGNSMSINGIDKKRGSMWFTIGWPTGMFGPEDYLMLIQEKWVGGSWVWENGWGSPVYGSTQVFQVGFYMLPAAKYRMSAQPTRMGALCPKSTELEYDIIAVPSPTPTVAPSPAPIPDGPGGVQFCNQGPALMLNGFRIKACSECAVISGVYLKKMLSCRNATGSDPNPPQITTCGYYTTYPGATCGTNPPQGCSPCVDYFM